MKHCVNVHFQVFYNFFTLGGEESLINTPQLKTDDRC
jgi:hypothetical protein